MSLWLPYLWQVLGLVLLSCRTSSAKDIELLVLRHGVAILRRTNPRPRMNWAEPGRVRRPRPAVAPRTTLPPLASVVSERASSARLAQQANEHQVGGRGKLPPATRHASGPTAQAVNGRFGWVNRYNTCRVTPTRPPVAVTVRRSADTL